VHRRLTVKKAYRKLSLKVHPDKTQSPGSRGRLQDRVCAFKCLSDPNLRQNFDTYGHEDPNQSRLQRQEGASAACRRPSLCGEPILPGGRI